MKKTLVIVLALFIFATPNAFAINSGDIKSLRMKDASNAAMKKEMIQEKITGTLQARAEKEITRRITSLQSKVERIDSMEKLTDEEKKRLSQFPVGQGLFFAGANHVHVQIIASPTETQLITTNPAQLQQLQALYQNGGNPGAVVQPPMSQDYASQSPNAGYDNTVGPAPRA